MNVKKNKLRNFDKENSFDGLNRHQGPLRNIKKTVKTGEQIRRRMRLSGSEFVLKNQFDNQPLRANNNFLNKAKKNSFCNVPALKKSVEFYPMLNTSRSAKSVRFEEKSSEVSLTRKHSTSSILKNRSNLKKSVFCDKSSMKSSICSNIGQQNQSTGNNSNNKIIKQNYEKQLKISMNTDSKYLDKLFPSLPSSLHLIKNERNYKSVTWMRLSDLFAGKYTTVYSRDPCSYQIIHNEKFKEYEGFANCLNTIKHNNFLLQKMFEISTYNKYGLYLVKINQNNSWKYIIIDDYIPVTVKEENNDRKKYEGAFINCIKNSNTQIEIWPYLLLKAYAKYYGTYESLSNINEKNFMEELTCCPLEHITVNTENMPSILDQIQNNDTIMMACDHQDKLWSIVPKKKAITVEKFGHHTKNLDMEDFINKFSKVYCIFLHKYFYTGLCSIRQSYKSQKQQLASIRYFKLEESTDCVLSIVQKDQKHYGNDYHYCWIRMILAQKQSQNNYRWIGGAYKNQKSTNLRIELQPGQYYVLIYPEWKIKPLDLNLVFYGNSFCQIQRKPYIGNQAILTQCAMDLAQRNGKIKQLNQNICTYTYIERELGLIIENINNQRPNGHIRILRSVQGLQRNKKNFIKAFNKQFLNDHTIEVKIESLQHYTVVLGILGGVNQSFLDQFDFGS